MAMAPRATQSVRFLVTVLALVALCGFAQGLVHALNAPHTEETASVGDPGRDPVPLARPLAPGLVLDETRVRQIAREEADAALVRSRPKKAAPKAEDDGTDDANAPAKPAVARPAEPAATPAPATPQPGPQ